MIKRLLLVAALAFAPVYALAQSSPDTVIRAFYGWYLPFKGDPINEKKILDFVTADTVQHVKNLFNCGEDDDCYGQNYFTKTQDWDEDDWVKYMRFSAPIYSQDSSALFVTMGSRKEMRTHLLILLEKVEKSWKIRSVTTAN